MTKRIVRRGLADRDAEAAFTYYLQEAGEAVALRFIDGLEAAIGAIGRHPEAGSPRYAEALGIPGLRSRRVARFPYLVFYAEEAHQVEVWRILHAQRDIASTLQDDAQPTRLGS